MEEAITISIEEYKSLLELSVRVNIFSVFVNKSEYDINREKCGIILGFEVGKKED